MLPQPVVASVAQETKIPEEVPRGYAPTQGQVKGPTVFPGYCDRCAVAPPSSPPSSTTAAIAVKERESDQRTDWERHGAELKSAEHSENRETKVRQGHTGKPRSAKVERAPSVRLKQAQDEARSAPERLMRARLRFGRSATRLRAKQLAKLLEQPPMALGRRNSKMETWAQIKEYQDLLLERVNDGIAKITINRPEVRNAFRPQTIMELIDAFALCRADTSIGVVILTGQGPEAFCSGADLKIGHGGYIAGEALSANILDVQRQIRTLPKPVIAMVAGYAIGGGHVLHVVCDITIAAENARFGQTGPKVGSFDAGLGSSYLARIVGQKRAREIWYLCRQYDAAQALEMGLVNKVVPLTDLERETLEWAREILQHSPLAIRCLKAALNADCDGQIGLMDLAGNTTLLYYLSEEAKEGEKAFLERRPADFSKFPRLP